MFLQLPHQKLDVYKATRSFVLQCYMHTRNFPPEERFNTTQQIRRAALSVHLNIAEGASRKSVDERKRLFEIARGSIIEIDAALDVAEDLGYINLSQIKELGELLIRCFQMLSKLISRYQ